MKYVLIVGANSDIAKEIARGYASKGFGIYLASMNIEALRSLAVDIKIRSNVDVQTFEFDITKQKMYKKLYDSMQIKPFGVVLASGYMPEQAKAEIDDAETIRTIMVNYTGAVLFLNFIANYLEEKKEGFIVGISSVAGDRGRKANYIYGSSKAGFSAYLSGLRNRLYDSGVHVLTVKPGFVRTKMTKGMEFPEKLLAEPEEVAADIIKAVDNRKNILYVKWVWKYIMTIINLIPEFIFKKLSI